MHAETLSHRHRLVQHTVYGVAYGFAVLDRDTAALVDEETEEVINFVYDEMRDYRLSTYLLGVCEYENGNVDAWVLVLCHSPG